MFQIHWNQECLLSIVFPSALKYIISASTECVYSSFETLPHCWWHLFCLFVLECHWVSVWSFADRCGLLSVFWSASHCSGQHWASSSFWEDSFQVLQVRETHFQQNVTTFLILFLVHFTLHYVIFTFENICWESGKIYVILSLSAI